MSDKLIRIELHHTRDYTELHAQAQARRIVRQIRASDGNFYELPTGTYYYSGTGDAQDARQLAQQAAVAAGHPDAAIVVADAEQIAWLGLKLIRKAA